MAKSYTGYTPGTIKDVVNVPTMDTTSGGSNATVKEAIWMAPAPCVLTGLSVVLNTSAITGDNTNRINLNVLDGDAAGTGTTEIGNHDFTLGVDLAQYATLTFTITETTMAEGDKLVLQAEDNGSGGIFGGIAEVSYRYV